MTARETPSDGDADSAYESQLTMRLMTVPTLPMCGTTAVTVHPGDWNRIEYEVVKPGTIADRACTSSEELRIV